MKKTTQQLIDRLAKSTSNVVNAKNASQREAARKFLVQRSQELAQERDVLADWLHEADTYLNAKMPGFATDAAHEHNREWIRKLREYQSMCDVIDSAWNAYMGTMEAA